MPTTSLVQIRDRLAANLSARTPRSEVDWVQQQLESGTAMLHSGRTQLTRHERERAKQWERRSVARMQKMREPIRDALEVKSLPHNPGAGRGPFKYVWVKTPSGFKQMWMPVTEVTARAKRLLQKAKRAALAARSTADVKPHPPPSPARAITEAQQSSLPTCAESAAVQEQPQRGDAALPPGTIPLEVPRLSAAQHQEHITAHLQACQRAISALPCAQTTYLSTHLSMHASRLSQEQTQHEGGNADGDRDGNSSPRSHAARNPASTAPTECAADALDLALKTNTDDEVTTESSPTNARVGRENSSSRMRRCSRQSSSSTVWGDTSLTRFPCNTCTPSGGGSSKWTKGEQAGATMSRKKSFDPITGELVSRVPVIVLRDAYGHHDGGGYSNNGGGFIRAAPTRLISSGAEPREPLPSDIHSPPWQRQSQALRVNQTRHIRPTKPRAPQPKPRQKRGGRNMSGPDVLGTLPEI